MRTQLPLLLAALMLICLTLPAQGNAKTSDIPAGTTPLPVFEDGFEFFVGCGDGLINEAENCDDLNRSDGDGCDSSCSIETGFSCTGQPSICMTQCGDGLIIGTESCDDLNQQGGDGCNTSCSIETGFSCFGQPSVCMTLCGDGLIIGSESCDDSNQQGGDGCNTSCSIETGFSCTGQPSVCIPDP